MQNRIWYSIAAPLIDEEPESYLSPSAFEVDPWQYLGGMQ